MKIALTQDKIIVLIANNVLISITNNNMTEIVETKITIHKIDLKKLFKGKSIRKICKDAKIDYNNVLQASKNHVRMSYELWEKIKKVLDN